MDEVRATRYAGWAGVIGILLLAVSFLVASWIDASDADRALRADIANAEGQSYLAYTLLTPAVALLLWFAVGLRRYLQVRCRAERLAGAVVPGMAMFTALTAAGISLILTVPLTSSWFDEYRIDVDLFRALSTAGAFVVFAAAVGGAVVVAAMSRAAETVEAIPSQLAWLGYAVAFASVFTLWTFGFTLLLLSLWLLGAAVGLIRGAGSMTGPVAEAAAAAAPPTGAALPTQTGAPAEGARPAEYN